MFGGSFDPPHIGHVLLPQLVREAIGAKWIAYIPAGRAPHKLDKKQTLPAHRVDMLRLALAESKNTVVQLLEVQESRRDKPSYTVDTLEILRKDLPDNVKLRLLIGCDQVRIFDQWREPERIIALAEPLVMVRPPDTRESLLASLADDDAREQWKPRLVDVPAMDISSTDIRQLIAENKAITGLVHPDVEKFIHEQGLYRVYPRLVE